MDLGKKFNLYKYLYMFKIKKKNEMSPICLQN